MKGIAILLMLLHHLFYSRDSAHGLPVSYLLLNTKQMVAAARFCKICVPAFVFVTAYGMAAKYETIGQGRKHFGKLTLRRYVSLMVSFLFVYVLAFVFCQAGGMRSYREVYGTGAKSVLYAVIDMLGMTYFTDTPTMNPTWWYMSVAILLIFVLPVIWKLTEKIGLLLVPALAAVMVVLKLQNNQAMLCLLTAAVGVWCEKRRFFDRISAILGKRTGYRIMGALAYLAVIAGLLVLKIRTGNRLWVLIYPLSAVSIAGVLCCGSGEGWIYRMLRFFGRYSMYMFLTHTFLKSYYLHDFIYGFGQAEVIYAVLIGLSAALAMALAFLERKFREKLRINEKIDRILVD